jgi:carbon monoxide dehydrogenase subunit G
MSSFEGDRDFQQAPTDLWKRLSDVRFLVECVPDVESVREVQADRAALVLKPGFSFVRGTLEVELRLLEAVAPTTVRVGMHSKGIGSSSEVELSLTLSDHAGGTRIHQVVEIKSLGGLLKLVPAGLIRGAAQKVLEDAWARLTERLEQEPPTGAASATP